MADQVTVNLNAVLNIMRKLQALEEETRLILLEADKTIQNAEIEGWNDAKYHALKDSFMDTKIIFNNALKKIEEDHIPYLRKIARSIEDM